MVNFNRWELRVLVLLSLFLQIVLITFGNRRKYIKTRFLGTILWLAYLSADAVATIALGVLSRTPNHECAVNLNHECTIHSNYIIMAIWAPFLLMHLGGPDTITAYALADNELWGRHLLELIGQVGIAIYVVQRSFNSSPLNYLSVVIFVAGLIKYGERTYVLFSASKDQFRESMVSRPDPGPNYTKFMDEFVSRESEGYIVSIGRIIDVVPESVPTVKNNIESELVGDDDHTVLQDAYYLFGTFKKLFADLILSFQDREISVSLFNNLSWDRACSIVEVELGLMYDLFYTKAFLLYSPIGCAFRLISCSCTVSALIAFTIIDKESYDKIEVIITLSLLAGAIFLEIYAVVMLLSLDRTMIWLSGDWIRPGLRIFKVLVVSYVCKIVSFFRYIRVAPAKMRWSNAMGQYNLLNYCLEGRPKHGKIRQSVENYLYTKSISIPKGLKAMIFDQLKERVTVGELHKKLGSYRGDKILLSEMGCFDRSNEVEFDQSVLLLHIATDLCYHTDAHVPLDRTSIYEFVIKDDSPLQEVVHFKREMSRLLSNYMIYLLIMNPFMLPSGIGQIRFQDTCAEAIEFFQVKNLSAGNACKKLLEVDTRISPSEVKGDRSKSVLFDACRLAKCLQSPEVEQKWDKITQAWLDILTFAASQCRWNDHAEKLSQGGELLTHVWLLMAHFGMTEQFQISQGYVRAKLQVK